MDLYEPGPGARIHDFIGPPNPSGLVWTVPLPDESVVVSADGRRLDVDVRDLQVIDSTTGGEIPAVVSFQITWKGMGKLRDLGLGNAVPATDPAAFLGRYFRRARARGSFSGAAGGFTFTSSTKRKARSLYAQLGTQQNGTLITGTVRCARCDDREGSVLAPVPQPW